MRVELTELVRVEIEETVTSAQLTERTGLSVDELTVLVEHGVVAPLDRASAPDTFPGEAIALARIARRLWRDFALDPDALALAMNLVTQVRTLEAEVRYLRAQLPAGGR